MKKLLSIATISALAVAGMTASAGLHQTSAFSWNPSTHTASGAFNDVRNANSNTNESINCQVLGNYPPATGFLFAECQAFDTAGNGLLDCWSTSSSILSVVQSIHSDSEITVTDDPGTTCGSGTCCKSVTVRTGSQYAPRQ